MGGLEERPAGDTCEKSENNEACLISYQSAPNIEQTKEAKRHDVHNPPSVHLTQWSKVEWSQAESDDEESYRKGRYGGVGNMELLIDSYSIYCDESAADGRERGL